jgi:hypothetical protein
MKITMNRILLSILILVPGSALFLGCGARPQDTAEEPGVTLPAGVLFIEDFSDRDLPGWKIDTGGWSAREGVLRSSRKTEVKAASGHNLIVLKEIPEDNYRIEVDFRFTKEPKDQAFAGVVFRYRDPFNFYQMRVANFRSYQDRVEFYRYFKGLREIEQESRHLYVNLEKWYHVVIEVEGGLARGWLDGREVGLFEMPEIESGTVGLSSRNADVEFRRFLVSEL